MQTIDDMSRLTKDLKALFELGYRYVFIDEITLLSDFIDTAAVLSDVFSMMGMKTRCFRYGLSWLRYGKPSMNCTTEA